MKVSGISGRRMLSAAAHLAMLAGVPPALGQSNSCSTATPILAGGSGAGTTAGATNDGSCSCGAAGGAPDVWYSFTAPMDGELTVDLCGSSYDTVLSIHSGCPGTTSNELGCNDDSCNLQSQAMALVQIGHTYYIRVSGYSGATGGFVIHASIGAPPPPPTAGPDVIVGEVYDMLNHGATGAITAYSIGTDSCNLGDAGVTWVSGTNQHPVITGNMFRLKSVNGAARFEQIGMSWCKHGFLATNGSFCGTCHTSAGDHLGPGGCSDIYSAGLNGSQGGLGARSEVNATTGYFPYPYVLQGTAGTIGKRCQVATSDIDPAQNANALYFADAHYVVPDDASWSVNGQPATNGLNNVSYRQISIPSVAATPAFVGLSHQQMPGIQAWKDQDPTVTLVNADYLDQSTTAGIVARFIVAAKATDLGGGVWHYEYAVYNLNADRSGGSFSVPIPAGAQITNVGFHAPLYHSGEPYDNTPWTSQVTSSAVTWTPASFNPPANANALRWATVYNFRFDANVAPGTGAATLGLFKPGTPASLNVTGLPVPGAAACYANCDQSTTAPVLNVNDFMCFMAKFAAGDSYANCDSSTTPPVLNVNDFTCFQTRFAAGCN